VRRTILFVLGLSCACLIKATPLEDLENAVKESNFGQVKLVLEKFQFSNDEIAFALDLAQEIIWRRKSTYECVSVSDYLPSHVIEKIEKSKLRNLSGLSFTVSGIMMLVGAIGITSTDNYAVNIASASFCGIGTIGIMVSSIVFLAALVNEERKIRKDCSEAYDNAIQIKSLLLKMQIS